MLQTNLSSQFRRLRLKQALSEIERIQREIESELNEPIQPRDSYDLITDQRGSKEIMKDNMISIEDVAQTFDVELSIGQITQLIP